MRRFIRFAAILPFESVHQRRTFSEIDTSFVGQYLPEAPGLNASNLTEACESIVAAHRAIVAVDPESTDWRFMRRYKNSGVEYDMDDNMNCVREPWNILNGTYLQYKALLESEEDVRRLDPELIVRTVCAIDSAIYLTRRMQRSAWMDEQSRTLPKLHTVLPVVADVVLPQLVSLESSSLIIEFLHMCNKYGVDWGNHADNVVEYVAKNVVDATEVRTFMSAMTSCKSFSIKSSVNVCRFMTQGLSDADNFDVPTLIVMIENLACVPKNERNEAWVEKLVKRARDILYKPKYSVVSYHSDEDVPAVQMYKVYGHREFEQSIGFTRTVDKLGNYSVVTLSAAETARLVSALDKLELGSSVDLLRSDLIASLNTADHQRSTPQNAVRLLRSLQSVAVNTEVLAQNLSRIDFEVGAQLASADGSTLVNLLASFAALNFTPDCYRRLLTTTAKHLPKLTTEQSISVIESMSVLGSPSEAIISYMCANTLPEVMPADAISRLARAAVPINNSDLDVALLRRASPRTGEPTILANSTVSSGTRVSLLALASRQRGNILVKDAAHRVVSDVFALCKNADGRYNFTSLLAVGKVAGSSPTTTQLVLSAVGLLEAGIETASVKALLCAMTDSLAEQGAALPTSVLIRLARAASDVIPDVVFRTVIANALYRALISSPPTEAHLVADVLVPYKVLPVSDEIKVAAVAKLVTALMELESGVKEEKGVAAGASGSFELTGVRRKRREQMMLRLLASIHKLGWDSEVEAEWNKRLEEPVLVDEAQKAQ